jgi:hypothetical protein
LWFGWYGFNCGSTLALTGGWSDIAALVGVNTALCGAATALTSAAMYCVLYRKITLDLDSIMNGALAGMASITAGCAVMRPWSSVVGGILTGLAFQLSDFYLIKFGIDDPISAVSVHMTGGAVGLLLPGLFAEPNNLFHEKGAFFGNPKQLGPQIVEILCVMAWSGGGAAIIFWTLNKLGILRVSSLEEVKGIDGKLGVQAYPQLHGLLTSINTIVQFDEVLESSTNINIWAFHKFLQLEFSADALDFVLVCRNFKDKALRYKNDVDKQKELAKMIRSVIKNYVLDNSPHHISLPESVREDLVHSQDVKNAAKGTISPSLFDVAEQEVYALLKGGPFKRFALELKRTENDPIEEKQTGRRRSLMSSQDEFDEALLLCRLSLIRVGNVNEKYVIDEIGNLSWVSALDIRRALRLEVGGATSNVKEDAEGSVMVMNFEETQEMGIVKKETPAISPVLP